MLNHCIINIFSYLIFQFNFTPRFEIEKRASGQFLLLTAQSLYLPSYPSTVNETTLYLTVECNQKAYPLMSIRIRNHNSHAPSFLNEPYEMLVPQVCVLKSFGLLVQQKIRHANQTNNFKNTQI
jgi:hypothetical protein